MATVLDDTSAIAAKTTLALQNVDNTADASKPVSTAQQTALDLKANIASPTFTGNVGPSFDVANYASTTVNASGVAVPLQTGGQWRYKATKDSATSALN